MRGPLKRKDLHIVLSDYIANTRTSPQSCSKQSFYHVTTHLLSIDRADWPKLHDMFKACDAIIWQREFPLGFRIVVSALNSLFINIFHDVVARTESRCLIKVKHVLLVC